MPSTFELEVGTGITTRILSKWRRIFSYLLLLILLADYVNTKLSQVFIDLQNRGKSQFMYLSFVTV